MRTLLLLTVLLAGCAAPAVVPEEPPSPPAVAQAPAARPLTAAVVAVGSTSAAADGVELAARRFMDLHPDVRVDVVRGLGTSGSIRGVAAGELDFTVASRALKEKEASFQLTQTPYVREGIVFAVDRAAGVSALDIDVVVAIYEGRVASWAELGGADLPVRLVTREPDDAELERVLETWPALNTTWGAGTHLVHTDYDKLAFLGTNAGAAGFVDAIQLGLTDADLVAVALEGVAFDAAALEAGRYPLTMSFHLVSAPDLDGAARAFHDYLLSAEWQETLQQAARRVS